MTSSNADRKMLVTVSCKLTVWYHLCYRGLDCHSSQPDLEVPLIIGIHSTVAVQQ